MRIIIPTRIMWNISSRNSFIYIYNIICHKSTVTSVICYFYCTISIRWNNFWIICWFTSRSCITTCNIYSYIPICPTTWRIWYSSYRVSFINICNSIVYWFSIPCIIFYSKSLIWTMIRWKSFTIVISWYSPSWNSRHITST